MARNDAAGHRRGRAAQLGPARAVAGAALVSVIVAGLVVGPGLTTAQAVGAVINVPADQPTIAAAVAAASTGDTIRIAPGTYQGGVWVQDKILTFTSWYADNADPALIAQTVISGFGGANYCGGASGCAGNAVVEFGSHAHGSAVVGLTITGGADGVRSSSQVDISHSRLIANEDGADYGNGAGGVFANNTFASNTDDGIDLNGTVALSIVNNTIEFNGDDGIEFRMYPYAGPTLTVNVQGNRFVTNDSDGIQLIDSPDASSRVVRVERNLFTGTRKASIGAMPNQNTQEDFSGAPLGEKVYVVNNTFANEGYGVVGGANSIVLNNVFSGVTASAVRRVGGNSIVARNLFWNATTNFEESNVDLATTLLANPQLTATFTLGPTSPAIDAGAASYLWQGETVLSPGAFVGAAPDLGAYEYDPNAPVPNLAPTVDAGPDRTVALPAGASLDGSVTDDGQPAPPSLSTTWSQAAGPGAVTFADAAAVDTTATFSAPGTYTLLLSASDGALAASDTVQVVVSAAPPPGAGSAEVRIATGSDDAEESATGSFSGSSSDIELVFDATNQQVGLRFPGLSVPRGATIVAAYVQFKADEAQSEATSLDIRGQATDNPATFTSADKISTRPRTTAAVAWTPAPWTVVGEVGANQRTPNLAPIVQEIVNRGGWTSGNALALLIGGTGHRTARAFEGDAPGAALLHVDYVVGGGPGNAAPVVDAGPNRTVVQPGSAALDGTVSDDGLPAPTTLTTTWSQLSGPGTTTFADAGATDTTATFSATGTYTLQLSATDGAAASSDTVQVNVVDGTAAVLVGAGDIARCAATGIDGEATAQLLDGISGTVMAVGDTVYEDGTPAEYATCYEPTWGRHKTRTRPAAGNHEYQTPNAPGYYAYFGAAAGTPGQGWYSYDISSWHVVVLNSECGPVGGCGVGSAQYQWLQADLAANSSPCTAAYWHQPRFSSGSHGSNAEYGPFWDLLYADGADVVISGHDHDYERFARQNPSGTADPSGMRQFVVGTGGAGLTGFGTPAANSEVRNSTTYGVLKLTLNASSYQWQFVPVAGQSFTDSGTSSCLADAPPPNQAPVVNAGPDLTITLPAGVALDGTVTDDGQPAPASLTTTWSQLTGPGTATFASAAAVDTTATFSAAGTYVLQLAASDGALSSADTVQVTVQAAPPPGSGTVEVRIGASGDDIEESATGAFTASSSDIELVFDASNQQVGLRFAGLAVPPGATITRAYVQFEADEVQSEATNLVVRAHAADNAPAFSSTAKVSTRPSTNAAVPWSPPAWALVGEVGPNQRTPDLRAVVQEVVGRPGWASGNALALLVTGTGHRTARAFEGKPAGAALLHVEYVTGPPPPNQAPTVDAGADRTISLPSPAALDATVTDDGQPTPAALTTTWSSVSGPGTVTFANPAAIDTTATFSAAGVYVLRLSASDGELSSSDTVQVTVQPPPPPGSATLEVRISAGTDDAEEGAAGAVSTNSTDLELVFDKDTQQVGLRFGGVTIPPGATISRAYVRFEADEVQSEVTNLVIRGQAADNAVTFSTANRISTRPRTASSANWSPPPWTLVGEVGPNQRTPDLTAIVQEIVGRPGWASGNALALVITGTGHRTARSVEGRAAGAPLLHIEYTTP